MTEQHVHTDSFGTVPDPDPIDVAQAPVPDPGLPELPEKKLTKREERRRKRRRRNLVIVAVIALALIAAGVWAVGALRPKAPADFEPQVEEVFVGDFSRSVESKGKIRPLTSSYVTSPVPGTVGELKAVEGARVKEGDLLFVVSNPELDEAVSDAQAESGAAWSAVSDAKGLQARAQTDLNNARRVEARAKARLDAQDDPLLRAELSAAYEAAQQASRGAEEMVNQAASAVNQAVASASTVDRALAKAKAQAALRVVEAPMDGVIIAVNITQGGPVTGVAPSDGMGGATEAAAAAVEIADLSSMVVRVSVSERDIASVEAGQQCVVTFEAIPSLEQTATVMRVAPKASGIDQMQMEMGMPGGQSVNFDVDVRIDDPDPRLLIGMTAQARIDITRQEGVILVSAGCVVFEDATYVDVVPDPADPSVTERREVELGESTDDQYVILKGLEPGEFVLNHLGAVSPAPLDEKADPAQTMPIGG